MSMTLDSHLDEAARRQALEHDVRAGLTAVPKSLPPKYFYDARGSRLFDEITRLPEYYLTRAERTVLDLVAAEVAAVSRADTLVELGSGTSRKTRLLLSALQEAGTLRRFCPFDVDPSVLTTAGEAISADYPGVQVHAVVGDFDRHLDRLPGEGHRLVAFLGSTIGNLDPAQRQAFLASLRATLRAGEHLLLGTDLVKDERRLLAAYDDAAGVTAAFNRNVLEVINTELGADFDPDRFEHVVRYDARFERVEMHLRADQEHHVCVKALDLEVDFAAGEEMRTEISTKFRRAGVEMELAAGGFEVVRWWTDPAGDFALSMSRAL